MVRRADKGAAAGGVEQETCMKGVAETAKVCSDI